MQKDYIPISCSFYDELESAAVKKLNSTIVYEENFEIKTIKSIVVNFKTKNREEFMILKNKKEIRLDKILSFNDLKPSHKKYC